MDGTCLPAEQNWSAPVSGSNLGIISSQESRVGAGRAHQPYSIIALNFPPAARVSLKVILNVLALVQLYGGAASRHALL